MSKSSTEPLISVFKVFAIKFDMSKENLAKVVREKLHLAHFVDSMYKGVEKLSGFGNSTDDPMIPHVFSVNELSGYGTGIKDTPEIERIYLERTTFLVSRTKFREVIENFGILFEDYYKLPMSYFSVKILHMKSLKDEEYLDSVTLGDIKWFYPGMDLKDKTLENLNQMANNTLLKLMNIELPDVGNRFKYDIISLINTRAMEIDKKSIYDVLKRNLAIQNGNLSKEQEEKFFQAMANEEAWRVTTHTQTVMEAITHIHFSKFKTILFFSLCFSKSVLKFM